MNNNFFSICAFSLCVLCSGLIMWLSREIHVLAASFMYGREWLDAFDQNPLYLFNYLDIS